MNVGVHQGSVLSPLLFLIVKMLGTGQDGGECCGKAIGEVNPSTLRKTTSLK